MVLQPTADMENLRDPAYRPHGQDVKDSGNFNLGNEIESRI